MRSDVLNGVITKKQAEERLRQELSFKGGLYLNYLLARPLDKVYKGGDWWQFVVNWMKAQGDADVVYTDGASEFATYVWKDGEKRVQVQVKLPVWLTTLLTMLNQVYHVDITNEQFNEILHFVTSQE
jgi:hypothetical protein